MPKVGNLSEAKAGYKSTEFWIALATIGYTLLVSDYAYAEVVAGGISTAYLGVRGYVKGKE